MKHALLALTAVPLAPLAAVHADQSSGTNRAVPRTQDGLFTWLRTDGVFFAEHGAGHNLWHAQAAPV